MAFLRLKEKRSSIKGDTQLPIKKKGRRRQQPPNGKLAGILLNMGGIKGTFICPESGKNGSNAFKEEGKKRGEEPEKGFRELEGKSFYRLLLPEKKSREKGKGKTVKGGEKRGGVNRRGQRAIQS